MHGFNEQEIELLRRLNTPVKIQNYLESIKINFSETCWSPRRVMGEKKAHCLEGAMLAAAAFLVNGEQPLVMDLKAAASDDDHVVAVYKRHGCWGSISKTNHAVLRYREPIYRNIHELAVSFFHEYFTHHGVKTLRSYSLPINLSRFNKQEWTTGAKNMWHIPEYIDNVKHFAFASAIVVRQLRRADPIEIRAGRLVRDKR